MNGGRAWNFCEEARCFGTGRRRRLDVPRLQIGSYHPGTRRPLAYSLADRAQCDDADGPARSRESV